MILDNCNSELASSNGVREGFAHWRPRKANAGANPEQTPNESEVAGFSGNLPTHMELGDVVVLDGALRTCKPTPN